MRKKTIDTIPVLSDEIEKILTAFSRSRSLPSSLVKRSNIILLAVQGATNKSISAEVGLHYNRVADFSSRFLKALPSLLDIEAGIP